MLILYFFPSYPTILVTHFFILLAFTRIIGCLVFFSFCFDRSISFFLTQYLSPPVCSLDINSTVNDGGVEAISEKCFFTCVNINRNDYLQDGTQGDTPIGTMMYPLIYDDPLKWFRRNQIFQDFRPIFKLAIVHLAM